MTNFRLFQLKEFADHNFKFDENGKKFSNWVENTVGKGETAHYEQFLLFSQCFQKTYCRHVKTRTCLGKGETGLENCSMSESFYHITVSREID